MDWNRVMKIKKFTVMKDVFSLVGEPLFKIEDRPLYYMGNGIIISYTEKKYEVENSIRTEYGVEGEYLLSIYIFDNDDFLIKYLELEDSGIKKNTNKKLIVYEKFKIGMTRKEIEKELKNIDIQKIETRTFQNNKFIFKCYELLFGNYTLYFFEKKINSRCVGIRYLFN